MEAELPIADVAGSDFSKDVYPCHDRRRLDGGAARADFPTPYPAVIAPDVPHGEMGLLPLVHLAGRADSIGPL
jgi:hypothetical protein